MGALIPFVPRKEASAKANFRSFITHCKEELSVFKSDLPFEADEWDLSSTFRRKSSNAVVSVNFQDWGASRSGKSKSMSEPMKSFVKAYFRYQQGLRLAASFGFQLIALRSLEVALIEFGMASKPWACRSDVLDRAALLVRNRYAESSAYQAGRHLEKLVEFMSGHGLLSSWVDWRSPLPRANDRQRIGADFDEARLEKLPSPAALTALAQIFRLASEPRDRLVVSLVAILCSAPDRVNEVLRLPVMCEVHDKLPESGEPTYGLRWFTSKNGDFMVKWIVRSMAAVVEEALQNIRQLTDQARTVAAWYEKHPNRMYIREEMLHLRDRDWVTTQEAGQLVFRDEVSQGSVGQWLRRHNIEIVRKGREYGQVRFSDVERTIIGMLPRNFPYIDKTIGLKYSNALCTFFRNSFHPGRGPYSCVIDVVEHGDIHIRLGAKQSRSIFNRFGFLEDDGSEIRLRSHQLRHYLNTLAQSGGLSQLDIAKWSGRRDVTQNNVYDHLSDRDVIADMKEALQGDQRLPILPPPASIVRRVEFASLNLSGAHTTEFGYCVHDFAMLPCQLHADCMNCDEQVCIKGDPVREENIRRQMLETEHLLKAAAEAAAEGDVGADRWRSHQVMTLARLHELWAILSDPKVPNGAQIRLSTSKSDSRLSQAGKQRLERASSLIERAL